MSVTPAQYRVYVRSNTTLKLVGEVDQYDKLTYTRTYNGLGTFVLQLDSTHPMASYLADPGYGIIINRITASGVSTEFSGPCRYFQRQGGDRKKLIVKGYDDMYWLFAREAYPVTSYLYETVALGLSGLVTNLYSLGETSGTVANDLTGSPNNGTYHGGYTQNQASLIDDPTPSTTFNGTTGYVSIPNGGQLPLGNNPYSLVAWFNYSGAPAATEVLAFLGTPSTTSCAYMGILSSGKPTFQMLGVNHTPPSYTLSVGIHQMVLTYDGTTGRLYVDGAQVVQGNPGTCTLAYGSAAFGCIGAGASNFFSGRMAWCGLYAEALSTTDITLDYATGVARYAAQQFDSQTGASETVCKHYVSVNAASSAFTERQVSNLTVEADSARGSTVTWNARFEQLIAKDGVSGLLQLLATAGGIGIRVVQTSTPALQFQVYIPANKTSSAIFSEGLGNLGDYTYEVDAQDIQNYVVAGGGGSGTSRTFATGANSSSETSYGRVEGFLNAGSSTSLAQLTTQITGQLDSAAEKTTFNAVLIETDGLQYGRDFGLGDTVTVYVDGATLQDIVRQVQVDLDPNNGETVTPVIGTPTAGQILAALRKFEKQSQALAQRVATLERAS